MTLFLEFKTNDKDDILKWIFNTYAITLIISVFSALYSIKIGTNVASVGSVFNDTRKVKFLSDEGPSLETSIFPLSFQVVRELKLEQIFLFNSPLSTLM